MDDFDKCQVPGCNRNVTWPEATYVFCGMHWWDGLTPRWRMRIRDAYREAREGDLTARQVELVEREAIAFLTQHHK